MLSSHSTSLAASGRFSSKASRSCLSATNCSRIVARLTSSPCQSIRTCSRLVRTCSIVSSTRLRCCSSSRILYSPAVIRCRADVSAVSTSRRFSSWISSSCFSSTCGSSLSLKLASRAFLRSAKINCCSCKRDMACSVDTTAEPRDWIFNASWCDASRCSRALEREFSSAC